MVENNSDFSPKFITTTGGHQLKLVGVSPIFISRLESTIKFPKVPTRKIETDIPGYAEEEEMTEDSLLDDEEKKIWEAYKAEHRKASALRYEKFTKAIFAKGVEVDMSNLEAWEKEQAYWGLEIPENPIDKKIEYIQNELLGGPEDILRVITGVLSLSGIPEEEMRAVEAMFRRALRRNVPVRSENAEGEMAVE